MIPMEILHVPLGQVEEQGLLGFQAVAVYDGREAGLLCLMQRPLADAPKIPKPKTKPPKVTRRRK
jgi:hypothetical protein